jgi:hypothetical protein
MTFKCPIVVFAKMLQNPHDLTCLPPSAEVTHYTQTAKAKDKKYVSYFGSSK